MKKHFKRLLLSFLALCLVLGLAGCGGADENKTDEKAEIEEETAMSQEEEKEANQEEEQEAEESEKDKASEEEDPKLTDDIIDGVNFEEVLAAIPADYNLVEYYEKAQDPLEGNWTVGEVDASFVEAVKHGQPHPTYSVDVNADENKILKTFDLVAFNGNINFLANSVKAMDGEFFDGQEASAWLLDHQDEERASTVIGDAELIYSQNAQGVQGSRSLFIKANSAE